MQNDGGPAFPLPLWIPHGLEGVDHDGMTLRDFFAAAALTGLIAQGCGRDMGKEGITRVVLCAYDIADAMIEAREKKS